jgi:hypothetical protein
MQNFVADHTVRVVRDKKPQTVKAHTAFPFTKAEQETILKARPGSLRPAKDENAGAGSQDANTAPLTGAQKAAEVKRAAAAAKQAEADAKLAGAQGTPGEGATGDQAPTGDDGL